MPPAEISCKIHHDSRKAADEVPRKAKKKRPCDFETHFSTPGKMCADDAAAFGTVDFQAGRLSLLAANSDIRFHFSIPGVNHLSTVDSPRQRVAPLPRRNETLERVSPMGSLFDIPFSPSEASLRSVCRLVFRFDVSAIQHRL